MLSLIIKISVFSIIFIFMVHHILLFLKSTLTIPKIKDLVNAPNKKYKDIYDTLLHKNVSEINSYTPIDLLPTDDIDELTNTNTLLNASTSNDTMKDELKSFLKKQLNN